MVLCLRVSGSRVKWSKKNNGWSKQKCNFGAIGKRLAGKVLSQHGGVGAAVCLWPWEGAIPCLEFFMWLPDPGRWTMTLQNIKFLHMSHIQATIDVYMACVLQMVHSCQQKSIGLKFFKSQTGSDVRYSCHHNSSRFTFPIFAQLCRFSVLHSLQFQMKQMYCRLLLIYTRCDWL